MRRRVGARSEGLHSLESLLSKALPPRFSVYEKMENVAENWQKIVGPQLAKHSAPIEIMEGELLVVTENPLAGKKLSMMGGNIVRMLRERWELEVEKVKVTTGRLPAQRTFFSGKGRPPEVRVKEEEVSELKARYIDELPEEAAESLARLQLFFAKRFSQRR